MNLHLLENYSWNRDFPICKEVLTIWLKHLVEYSVGQSLVSADFLPTL